MQAKDFIKASQQLMRDHFTLLIMRGIPGLRRKPTEKNNG
jgi:hypothetical protein